MKKAIASLLLLSFFFTLSPPSLETLAIDEPNPEGFRRGDKSYIQMNSHDRDLSHNFDCQGIWDVLVKNNPAGKSLYFQQDASPFKGVNMFHPDKIDEWITAFNGSSNYVKSQLSSYQNIIYHGSSGTVRYYLRDIAELCGMHYDDSITWSPQKSNANITDYPSATLTIPVNVNPGGKISWTAAGKSYVKSKDLWKVNKISYTLKQDGKVVASETLSKTGFTKTGSFTVPKTAAAGTKYKYELSVTDGVGRTKTTKHEVEVVLGAVTPAPPAKPEPVDPPDPPPPPNYEPECDFSISNTTPVEGSSVQLRDWSTHKGTEYGESIVKWDWTIEGQPESTEKDVTATWNEIGTYSITLEVEDQDGESDSCTKSVVVGPALPAAVISVNPNNIIMGRKITIDGDQSTAAMKREIQWDKMQWEFTKPDGSEASFTGRYPVPDRAEADALIDQTGNWKVSLKVIDSKGYESEWTDGYFTVYPDNPPVADFWIASETLRNSYQSTTLAITDLSTPGTPDASLGDTITSRQWTLYYDADNDGVYDSGQDEIICAGDAGKAARLTEAADKAGNDPSPVIKFAKTGRYQLELRITESHIDEWTGDTVTGLSADTLKKAEDDKKVAVINIAPTVSFDIKKKVPVDIQFAVDYTVSNSKFNNLLSSDAGFKNTLAGASLNPVTGIQKVNNGEIGENYSVTVGSVPYIVSNHIMEDWYHIQAQSYSYYYPVYAMNIKTGQVVSDFTVVASLNDGTYIQGVFRLDDRGYVTDKVISGVRVDKNLNIIKSKSAYDAAIQKATPPDEMVRVGSKNVNHHYIVEEVKFSRDGSVLIWFIGRDIRDDGKYGNYYRNKVVKLDSNLNVVYSTLFSSYEYDNYFTPRVELAYAFDDRLFFIFSEGRHTEEFQLLSVGSSCIQLTNWEVYETYPDANYGSTANGKFFILGKNERLEVYSSSGLVTSRNVPTGTNYACNKGRCVNISSWNSQNTIALYRCVWKKGDDNKDDAYLYLINENTGMIDAEKQYYDILYPPEDLGFLGESGKWDDYTYRVEATILNSKNIGIKATKEHDGHFSGNETSYYSVIRSDLSIGYTSDAEKNYYHGSPRYTTYWHPITDNVFGIGRNKREIDDYYGDEYWDDLQIFNNNCDTLLKLPTRNYEEHDAVPFWGSDGFDNGYFYTAADGKVQVYSSNGTLLWQKPMSYAYSGSCMGLMVGVYNGSLSLMDLNTGALVTSIPNVTHLYHNNDYLLCCGSDGKTIICYGQLQGLRYVNQVLTNHTWDSDNYNFIVSVIDNNKYNDYSTMAAKMAPTLLAQHVKFVAISPAQGNISSQAKAIINNCEGGWWIQTNADMSKPLGDLAQKIIQFVNDNRTADNVVLVNEPVELKSVYQDSEADPAHQMRWEFAHDPNKLGDIALCSPMGLSSINGQLTTPPTSFDKAGTYTVKCKAQDDPVTNAAYLNDSKCGRKWSSDDGYLTILVHRRPVAAFSVSAGTATMNGNNLVITDNSYDPDTVTTDPEGKKGIRNWQWQYHNETTGDDWTTSDTAPATFPSKGKFAIRLRVQDLHGAWSSWVTRYVDVINAKPIAMFEAVPNPVNINTACSLLDHSYDPDGDKLTAYKWTVAGVGTYNRTDGSTFTVSWPKIGIYNVTLEVQDTAGQWSDPYTLAVKVIKNSKPIASFTLPAVGYEGETFLSNGTGSYDPDAGDRIQTAYWQYKKPGSSWSNIYTQHYGDAGFLYFYSTPADGELGIWTIRLVVKDTYGLESDPVEKTIEVKEGFEVTGWVTPAVGERGRNMRITAYAHRKNNQAEKLQINNMTAYIVNAAKPDGSPAMPAGQTPQAVNMVYDPASKNYTYTFLVPERVQHGRWPDDGSYYIKIVGTKNGTQKEAFLPCAIKGNVLNRVYIKTRKW